NTLADSTEGYIGSSTQLSEENYINCFDVGGVITSNYVYSPFITYKGGTLAMENSYYINNVCTDFSKEDYGAYFSFSRVNDRYLKLNEYKYHGVSSSGTEGFNASGIFLTPPDRDIFIKGGDSDNPNIKLEFDITYEDDSQGMEAFNVYLWTGRTWAEGSKASYNINAVFTDINGETDNVDLYGIKATSDFDSSMASFEVPDELDPKIIRVVLEMECDYISTDEEADSDVISEAVYMRGFTWVPKENTKTEAVCTPLNDRHGIGASILSLPVSGDYFHIRGNEEAHVISDDYLDDVFSINWLDNEYYYIKKTGGEEGTLSIGIDEGDTGEKETVMDSFIFYPTGRYNSSNKTIKWQYSYYANIYTDGSTEPVRYPETGVITTPYCDVTKTTEGQKQVIPVGNLVTDKVYQIDIVFTKSTSIDNYDSDKDDKYIYMRGFGWIAKDETKEEPIPSRISYDAKEKLVNKAGSRKMLIAYDKGTPSYAYYKYDPNCKIKEISEDPMSKNYYADQEDYTVSAAREDGSNSRIKVYEDIDPKFVEFIQEQYVYKEKLDTPRNLTLARESSYLTFTWDEVAAAYAYEIYYEITEDESGSVIEASDKIILGKETTSYMIANDSSWEDMGYSITFNVVAVNGYRYIEGGSTEYDSDPASLTKKISKKVLPAPQVHMELTDDNNMAVVLDNREDYKNSDGEYIDCDIEITHHGRGIVDSRKNKYVIHVTDSKYSTQSMWVELDQDETSRAQILSKAVPNSSAEADYVESAEIVSSGHLADNEELRYGDADYDYDDEYEKYKGMTYIPYCYKKRLRGFRGEDVEHMEYVVQYKHFVDRDAWMRTDISVYDEELGMWVAEVTNEAHIGTHLKSTDYITTLDNLPKEWFSEDNPTQLLVRNYLARSENDIVLYGHDVAGGIELNGASAEENKEIIKQYKDPYCLSIDWDSTSEEMQADETYNIKVYEDVSIWDEENDCLKPGYVLYKEATEEDTVTYG
ncbi:MAG: hypothetical protein K6E98_08335, partial [Lachnospiraceae bacterium]|nr:hypothetical protein [Lachnospiraceae bacterium]